MESLEFSDLKTIFTTLEFMASTLIDATSRKLDCTLVPRQSVHGQNFGIIQFVNSPNFATHIYKDSGFFLIETNRADVALDYTRANDRVGGTSILWNNDKRHSKNMAMII